MTHSEDWPPIGSRDPRATQVLRSRLRVQAWLEVPNAELPDISLLDGNIVETTVVFDAESNGLRRTAMLIEFDASTDTLGADWTIDQARMRRAVARFRFLFLGLPRIISGRLIDLGDGSTDHLRIRVCHPAAFGAVVSSRRAASSGIPMFQAPFMDKVFRPEVDRALQWYFAALDSSDPFAESAFIWMAIEALAPVLQRTTRCGSCQKDLQPCSECGASQTHMAVTAGIIQYLEAQLGIPAKETRRLYGWRSRLMHGEADRDFPSFPEAREYSGIIRDIANRLIGRELGIAGQACVYHQHPDHVAFSIDSYFSLPRDPASLDTPFPLYDKLEVVVPEQYVKSVSSFAPAPSIRRLSS